MKTQQLDNVALILERELATPKQTTKDTHWLKNPLENSIRSALCDAYDIRNVLSAKIKNRPKDNEGTEFTIGDCLDNIIDTLSELESMAEEKETEQLEILEAAWYAVRHHFDELAYYLDLSDDSMNQLRQTIRAKIDGQLEEK
jgi:hypothetical protein